MSLSKLKSVIVSFRDIICPRGQKCKKKLLEWYRKEYPETEIAPDDIYIVWACKTLQNYKCLASTAISGDGIYAEYTYNGDKQELYEDVYRKIKNTKHEEE